MFSTKLLLLLALGVLLYEASADNYIVTRTTDDLVRLLKAGCGSARLLLTTAKANNLKPPYSVSKGQNIQLPCTLPSKIQTYVDLGILWTTPDTFYYKLVTEITNADDCKAACLAESKCKMADWEPGCYFYDHVVTTTAWLYYQDNFIYVKIPVEL